MTFNPLRTITVTGGSATLDDSPNTIVPKYAGNIVGQAASAALRHFGNGQVLLSGNNNARPTGLLYQR